MKMLGNHRHLVTMLHRLLCCLKAIDLGLRSVKRSRPCLEGLQKLVQELEGIEVIVNSSVASNEEVTSTAVDCGLEIQDPPLSVTVGRPLKKPRIVSALEKALEKSNDQLKEKGKPRACGICKDLGHYRSTCPQLKK
eukprot:TRINITY_DN5203_c0_g1_i1.p1 TRINITY_DN5203_c0_g1~~TRINITY_DN5203_c0_g1_i1.p1  ORF type:complete len:137 (-),score=19.85 TRINITY_DN5203_c0_g1_i1:147-557(-)